jgi:hypothetical protein
MRLSRPWISVLTPIWEKNSIFIHGHIHQNFGEPSERVTIYKSTRVVNTYGHCVLESQVPSNTQSRC